MRSGWFAIAMACTGGPDLQTDLSEGDRVDTSDSATDIAEPATLQIVIRDPSGTLLPGVRALVFTTVERLMVSDERGTTTFVANDATESWWAIELVPPDARSDLAPVRFGIAAPTSPRTIDVTLPQPGAPAALPKPADWIAAAEGLEVFAGEGAFEAGPFEAPIDELAGARPTSWLPVDGIEGTVLGQWILMPVTGTATVDVPVRFDCVALDCDDPSPLELWQVAPGTAARPFAWERRGPLKTRSGWLEDGSIRHLHPLAVARTGR